MTDGSPVREQFYAAFSAKAPYGAVLVRRRVDGRVAVGAAFQNERAFKPVIDQLKDVLKKESLNQREIVGLFEDSEEAAALSEMAENAIPVGWGRVYKPTEAGRQALESLIATQGPATSKFQIDNKAPGRDLLAQAIDNKTLGGVYDALALCCGQIEDDFPGRPTEPIEVRRSLGHYHERDEP